MRLSESMINKVQNPSCKQMFLWDSEVPGLGVRISKRRKSYVVRTSQGRKRHISSIGICGITPLDEAREIARAKIINRPVKKELLFLEVSNNYIDIVASKTKKSWESDVLMLKSNHFAGFNNMVISEITPFMVDKWHKGIKAPYRANRCLALLSAIFTQAIKWGMVEVNPCKGVSRNREFSRDTFIEKDFYPTFLEAVEAEHEPYPTIVKLLLHTGLRKTELLSLKWEDVNFNEALITIPDTKNGKLHTLPLSKVALSLVTNLPRKGEYLFMYEGKRLQDIKKPWLRIRKKIGRKNLRIHDLRRTIGSWLAQSGVSLHLIGEVLNHKNPKTTMVYARFQKTHVRDAIERVFD